MSRTKPGLRVNELVTSDLGSQDLWQGTAQVFVKAEKVDGSHLILHEYLAARLANSLGIPVPFGEVADVTERREAWATAIAGRDGRLYGPPDAKEAFAEDPHIIAGIAVFDVWIFNHDRTDRNLVWSESIGAWAIDHEGAFLGNNSESRENWRNFVDNPIHPGALKDIGIGPDDVRPWLNVIRAQGPRIAEHALSSCKRRGLITATWQNQYLQFLKKRAAAITPLTMASLAIKDNPHSKTQPGGGTMDPIVH